MGVAIAFSKTLPCANIRSPMDLVTEAWTVEASDHARAAAVVEIQGVEQTTRTKRQKVKVLVF